MVQGPFTVQKALNNNVVIAQSDHNQEVIFIGKGIGFGMKNGDYFESTTYDKVYSLVDEQEQEKYIRLVTKETEETLLIIHESIEKIHEVIGFQLGEQLHFALTQHLALALQRTRDRTEIQNPFLTETKWLYYDTYQIAESVVAFIHDKTGLRLPGAEVGFITLHIQSAIRDSHSSLNKESDLLVRCVRYIEEKAEVKLSHDLVSFRRLIHHIKQIMKEPVNDEGSKFNEEVILMLKENNPLCYNISRNLVRMIEKSARVSLGSSEVIHLMIYVQTVLDKQNKT
ncbi:hypothetical protein CR194_11020 [Salipaludibacillus keqinensis]|uniref:PRD domain-containing protein n=1 Tax=Salipaludibacillus keqinensis TaxID=2045207 RepID=A0A323TFT0_9BACI|nr:PRD domain-containing protein [Salipaludibacillus keqinensis]PYZ93679.1 hypothetical protein CR194_11020 [Salipaludibacillus keqinensis]